DLRQERLRPGMTGALRRVKPRQPVVEKMAADISARNSDQAREGNENVGKILTDSSADRKAFIERRIDSRALGLVGEAAVDRRIDLAEQGQGIVAAGDTKLLRQRA